jgi:hypothetical protein
MTCPGLHCPGCTEGQSLAITSVVVVGLVLAAETVQAVAERVLWIGGTMAVCLALSVAASMWLEARADRQRPGMGSRPRHLLARRRDPVRARTVRRGRPGARVPCHRPGAAGGRQHLRPARRRAGRRDQAGNRRK